MSTETTKHTREDWIVSLNGMAVKTKSGKSIASLFGCDTSIGAEEMNANAKLMADAANTANKCGLLPSQLLQQRNDLLAKATALVKLIEPTFNYKELRDLKEAIEKAKKHGK